MTRTRINPPKYFFFARDEWGTALPSERDQFGVNILIPEKIAGKIEQCSCEQEKTTNLKNVNFPFPLKHQPEGWVCSETLEEHCCMTLSYLALQLMG